MSSKEQSKIRYYPTEHDLSDAKKIRAVLQQVLKQHYELVDAHAELLTAHENLKARVAAAPPPPSGPTNTQLLGLQVRPIDAATLANGATLKWDKASGTFIFS